MTLTALSYYNLYVRRIVTVLGILCAVAVFLYGAFLLMAVAHAASIASTAREVRTLTSEVSKLEASYLSLTKSLTIDDAVAMGFVKPTGSVVVYAAQSGLSLNR